MITLAAEIRAISLGEAESLTDTHRYPVPQVRPHRSRTAQIPRLTVQLLAPSPRYVGRTWDTWASSINPASATPGHGP